jgi:conjugal transfer pilus assembly protein TraB
MFLLVLCFVGVLVFIGWIFMPEKSSKGMLDINNNNAKQKEAKLDGIITTDSQFSKESSQMALEEQQREIKSLYNQLKNVGEQVETLQSILGEMKMNDSSQMTQEMQAKISEIESAISKKSGSANVVNKGITTVNFSYKETKKVLPKIRTAKDYVPPGTFAKAVLLNGADTNAGVNGQTDTTPITMRILDDGTLPNGEKSSLKGCFVTAAAYGDASSERGQIRLQRLSCVRKPSGQILDVPVEGTINDMGGSDGIRGHVIMRNNKLIWNAGISGMLSGFGNAMRQTLTNQTVSPLGVASNALKSSKTALQYGAFGGANTAFGKLADYYIKLADMYHPIVQVHAGSEVNVVFLKGFSLTEGLEFEDSEFSSFSSEKGMNRDVSRSINSQNEINEINNNLMQTIREAQLGQEVNYDGTNDVGETR